MSKLSGHEVGDLMATVIHDLRNPLATVGANIAFVHETAVDDPETDGALRDASAAVDDLMKALDQLACIARWLGGKPATQCGDGDVVLVVRSVAKRYERVQFEETIEHRSMRGAGAGGLPQLLDLLVDNSHVHAPSGAILLRAREEDGEAVVELQDTGKAIAEELRPHAFSVAGQELLKGRADGRYGKSAALVAVRAIADSMGAQVRALGVDGAAIFQVRLKIVPNET